MSGKLVLHAVRALAVALIAVLPHSAQADATAGSQAAWARTTPQPDAAVTDPLVRRGKTLFDGHCRTCHGAAPTAVSRGFYPGTYALQQRYQGKLPAALEERTDLSADRVVTVVRHGGGGFMPPIRPTELNDDELKAVAAYLSRRSAPANHP